MKTNGNFMRLSPKHYEKRSSTIQRRTRNRCNNRINIDGTGTRKIETPVRFEPHAGSFAKHGLFNFEIKAQGDTYIDEPHS